MPKRKAAQQADKIQEEELQGLTNEQLRNELIMAGKQPGPIDSSNRAMYIRSLIRLKKTKEDSDSGTGSSPAPKPKSPIKGVGVAGLTRSPLSKVKNPAVPTKLSAPSLAIQHKAPSIFSFNIRGLLAAPFTPFTDDGEVNYSVIKSYADFLCKQGVFNVFVCGTTGEGLSMSIEERQQVAEEWIKASKKRLKIVVHVGSENLKSCCQLAVHAVEAGADAIAVMPPSYFKPPTLDALVLYLEKIGEAAPSLPMFYYHIPSMTGVKFSMEELLDMASSRLPTLRGIKFTHEDLMEYSRCLAHSSGKYLMMYGRDEQVLGSYCMGGTAAVGSTYNYSGKLNNRMLAAYERGDIATAQLEQKRAQAAIHLLHKYGGSIGTGKAFMRMSGMDLGPPRLPLFPLSAEKYKALQSDLVAIGFFDWA